MSFLSAEALSIILITRRIMAGNLFWYESRIVAAESCLERAQNVLWRICYTIFRALSNIFIEILMHCCIQLLTLGPTEATVRLGA